MKEMVNRYLLEDGCAETICILAIRAAMAYLFIETQLLLIQHFVAEQL